MPPVRLSAPLGAVGLILPTFVQRTVPAWAEPVDELSTDVDPLAELAARCRRAEAAGTSALWVCDHQFGHGTCLECRVTVTVAATVTDRPARGRCMMQLPIGPTAGCLTS